MSQKEVALIDAILTRENMAQAWERVRANKSAPGVDGVTLKRWARNLEANLERLREQVRTNTYRPNRPKRFQMRTRDGKVRELARLTVADKVLQRAALNVLEGVYDPRFLSCSHGYRPRRSTATAVQQVLVHRDQGLRWVVDADIAACFDNLDHELIVRLLQRVVKDWFVLNLTTLWLQAGRKHRRRAVGVPLGAVLAPLWCNIVLHQLDAQLSCAGWKLVRYADDFVILTAHAAHAELALEQTRAVLARLRLQLAPAKTRVTNFDEGFRFLGVDFERDRWSYTWERKRIEVQGRNVRWLYKHAPQHY